MTMSDALDYDKSIIETIHHIEDILVRFALQNYAAAGAVFLAYFTQKMSLRMAAAVIVGLGVVFTLAIWANIARYRLFWKLHRIARDNWLAGQSVLRQAYRADAECEKYLRLRALPLTAFLPVIVINLVPAAGAVLLFWWRRS
jgi:hypothetical protein